MDNQFRKLYRSKKDRIIGGVGGGLAQYFNLDPIIVRIIFILLAIADGAGILIYIILWIFVPEEPGEAVQIDREKKIEEFAEGVKNEFKSWAGEIKSNKSWWEEKRNLFAILVIIVGLLLLFHQLFGWRLFNWNLFWPIAIIIVGLFLIFKRKGE